MSSWFRSKKPSNTDEQLKLTLANIEQSQKTNSELRRTLEDVREAARRNKILLDELLHNASSADLTMSSLKNKISEAELQASKQDAEIAKLLKEKQMLENRVLPTSMAMTSINGQSVQEILDTAEHGEEQIFFKDSKGTTWEILKRSDMAIEDELSSSDLSFDD